MAYRNRPGGGGYTPPSTTGKGNYAPKIDLSQDNYLKQQRIAKEKKRKEDLARKMEEKKRQEQREKQVQKAIENKPSQGSIRNATIVGNINKQFEVNPYTDPYAINSLSDAIFNKAAKNLAFPQDNYLAQTTKALVTYGQDKFTKPLGRGDFGTFMINGLTSLGEDLSFISGGSLVRGAVIESGLTDRQSTVLRTTGAVLGSGAAIAASGPVGWATILGIGFGAVAGSGLAHLAGATVKDPKKALLGIKKASGLSETYGKTNYRFTHDNGEDYGFINNMIATMATDPASWISTAGMLMKPHVSKGMEHFLKKQQMANTKASNPTLSELNKVSTTITDKLFMGTQAIGKLDKTATKLVTMSNPLGATMYAGGYGLSKGYQGLQRMYKMNKLNDKGINEISHLTNVKSAEQQMAYLNDDALIKKRSQQLAHDMGAKSIDGSVSSQANTYLSYSDSIPDDLSVFREFIAGRKSSFIKEGVAPETAIKRIQLELEGLISLGTVDEAWDAATQNAMVNASRLINRNMPQEMRSQLITDLLAGDMGAEILNRGITQNAMVMYHRTLKNLNRNSSKLEVFAEIETHFAEILDLSPGTDLAEAFLLVEKANIKDPNMYKGLKDTMINIFNKYDITGDEFAEYLAKNTNKLTDFASTGGTKYMMSNVFAKTGDIPITPLGPDFMDKMGIGKIFSTKANAIASLPIGLEALSVPDYVMNEATFALSQNIAKSAGQLVGQTAARFGPGMANDIKETLNEYAKRERAKTNFEPEVYLEQVKELIDEVQRDINTRKVDTVDLGKRMTDATGMPLIETAQIDILASRKQIFDIPKAIRNDLPINFKALIDTYDEIKGYDPNITGIRDRLIGHKNSILDLVGQKSTFDYLDLQVDKVAHRYGVQVPDNFNGRFKYEEVLDLVKEKAKDPKIKNDPELYAQLLKDAAEITKTLSHTKDAASVVNSYGAAAIDIKTMVEELNASIDPLIQQDARVEFQIRKFSHLAQDIYLATDLPADQLADLRSDVLHKRDYYTGKLNNVAMNLQMMDQFTTKNKAFLMELQVDHGEIAVRIEHLLNMEMSGTAFNHLQTSAKEVLLKSKAATIYRDLAAHLTAFIQDNNLDPQYFMSVMDVISGRHNWKIDVFIKGLLDGDHYSYDWVENNLGMMGLDTNLTDKFVGILLDYAKEVQYQGIPEVLYQPGAGFSEQVEDFKLLLDDFESGLQEFDDNLSEQIDLELLGSSVLDNVSAIKEINTQMHRYAIDKTGHDTSIRRANQKMIKVGFQDAGSFQTPEEAYVASQTPKQKLKSKSSKLGAETLSRSKGITANSQTHYESDLQADQAFYPMKDIIMNQQFSSIPKSDGTVDQILASRDSFTNKTNFNNSNLELVSEIFEYTEAMLSIPDNDYMFRKDGIDVMLHRKAEVLASLPADDIARMIKFETGSELTFIEMSTMPDGLPLDVIAELNQMGISFERVQGNPEWVIRKDIQSDAYDALQAPQNRYTMKNESGLNIGNSEGYEGYDRLNKFVMKSLNKTSVFESDINMPIRLHQPSIKSRFENNPGRIAAAGGPDRVEILLKGTPRSRGTGQEFIGSIGYIRTMVNKNTSSGYSYLPGDALSNMYNVAEGLVHHNNEVAKTMNLITDPRNSISGHMPNHSAEELLQTLKDNPGQVVTYLNNKQKIASFDIQTVKDAQRAIDLDLNVYDEGTYQLLFEQVNQMGAFESGIFEEVLTWYRRVMNTPFVGAAMTSFSAWFRNMFDTFQKNMMGSGEVPDVFSYLKRFNTMYEMMKMSNSLDGILDIPKTRDKYFMDTYPDPVTRAKKKAEFFRYKALIDNGVLDGFATSQLNQKYGKVDADGNKIKKKLSERDLIRDVSMGNWITRGTLKMYEVAEIGSRLELAWTLLDQGIDMATVVAKVNEMHGNYNTRTDAEMLVNTIFPFFSFPVRNMFIWIKYFHEHPIMVRALLDSIIGPHVNDDYTAKQLSTEDDDNFQKYNLMQGNLMKRRGEYTEIMKLNPSMFDALSYIPKWLHDPYAKLGTPIKNMKRIYDNTRKYMEDGEFVEGEHLLSDVEVPYVYQGKRFLNAISRHATQINDWINGREGGEEGYRDIKGLVPSLFSVSRFDPDSWKDLDYDTLAEDGTYKYGYKKGVTPADWDKGIRPQGYRKLNFEELDDRGKYKYGYKKGVSPAEWDRGIRPQGYKPLDFEKLDANGRYQYGYKKGVTPAEWEAGKRPAGYKPLDFDKLDDEGKYQYGYKKGVTPAEWKAGKRPKGYKPLDFDELDENGKYQYGYKKGVSPAEWDKGIRPKGYVPLDFDKLDSNGRYQWGYNKGKTPKEVQAQRGNYGTRGANQYGGGAGGRVYIPYQRQTYARKPAWGRTVYPKKPAWGRTVYGQGRKYAKHPYQKFGAPDTYTAKGKGNRALSTGFVTKNGKFRSSGGIGYGNTQANRSNAMGMGFGRYGAYLYNAPQGVKLKRLDYHSRSLYGKQYSKSGNSRLLNRTKTISDPKSLMFRLQDMRYNMF